MWFGETYDSHKLRLQVILLSLFQDICCPDFLHPKYLPRAELFTSLIDILFNTAGRVRQTAVNTLIEVASSASGQTGCAVATDREVSILLGALQNDSELVRDAALRGLLAMQDALQPDNENLVKIGVAQ